MHQPDILIHGATIVTVDENFTIVKRGAVAITAGRIDKVWSPAPGETLPCARESLDASGAIVMPGLVNAHTHLPMSLFRGLADDMALHQWLHDHMFPAEARYITERNVVAATRLSLAEMLLGGTTACCDGYFLSHHIAKAVEKSGMRALLGQGVIDFPAPGVPDPDRNVAEAEAFVRRWRRRSPMIRPSIFCHSPYACCAQTLRAAKAAANAEGLCFQIHVAETQSEVRQCQKEHGCSPPAYLQRLGILDEKTILIHMVWADGDDIRRVADSGATIAHCPESNMKLASGVAPIPDFLEAGITVGLGTDGCASNNDLSLFGEMDTAAKLHKVQRLDPTVLDAATVVQMATMHGARIMGLDQEIGSLAAGKQADLIIVDTQRPHLTPIYNPASHLVYAATAADVRHVLIGGRWVVRQRQLLTMDLPAVLREAARLGRAIGQGAPC